LAGACNAGSNNRSQFIAQYLLRRSLAKTEPFARQAAFRAPAMARRRPKPDRNRNTRNPRLIRIKGRSGRIGYDIF
jgi:hypothetical protein